MPMGWGASVEWRGEEGVNGASGMVAKGDVGGSCEGPGGGGGGEGKAQALAADIMKGVLLRSRSRLTEVRASVGANSNAEVSESPGM